ncbi:MOSC domain-containing protein [Hymenobacter terricola]|uniref:MOSC domain-containing protein n=1 Tax=Hymenobacter terricola TaxID=2819236 RepID=UPI001B310C3F|nr:MOSC domain-containing protein [Hymenobacter terricola]
MQLLSVNVGLPRTIEWHGRAITTAIFKQPVTGSVALAPLNLAGDQQADLRVHGGPDKAVYAYDMAHYAAWRAELPAWTDWTPGLFGENLTTEGLPDAVVRIGDVFGVGTARLRAVQPRQPCHKLNLRFDDPGMVHRFAQLNRPGIYFRVLEPGIVRAGDAFELLEAAATDLTIPVVARLLLTQPTPADADLRTQAVALPHLPEGLKRHLFGR